MWVLWAAKEEATQPPEIRAVSNKRIKKHEAGHLRWV